MYFQTYCLPHPRQQFYRAPFNPAPSFWKLSKWKTVLPIKGSLIIETILFTAEQFFITKMFYVLTSVTLEAAESLAGTWQRFAVANKRNS
jgi:hypothetical protein